MFSYKKNGKKIGASFSLHLKNQPVQYRLRLFNSLYQTDFTRMVIRRNLISFGLVNSMKAFKWKTVRSLRKTADHFSSIFCMY